MVKIMEEKGYFFENVSKINKSLVRLTNLNTAKIHSPNIRNETEDITIDLIDIKRIIKEYLRTLL